MMRLQMLLDTVKLWWRPVNGTVSMWDLTKARLLDKLCHGPIYILSLVEKAMYKIQSAVYETQSRAKATISLRTIEQIKPVKFEWQQDLNWKAPGCNNTGFIAQQIPGQMLSYHAGTGVQSPQYISTIPNNTITFNQNNKPVLTITQDGDVEWTGKPSEAADSIMQVLQLRVEDKQGITKAARRRYYAAACRNILEQAENMEYEEFLAYLNREVYNREKTVILDSLKGEEDAG
jgi:hypothetical protein